MSNKVLYVTATLPALTVTFIYKEIFRLRKLGVAVDCVSMNTPAPREVSEEARPLLTETTYLDQAGILRKIASFSVQAVLHPLRTLRCFGILVRAKPMKGARDYVRLGYHLLEAGYLCRTLRMQEIRHIHAHFINGPTSIAMFLGELSGTPFSFTMHASMIWLDPIAFVNKLERCAFCASISEYNRTYVLGEYGDRFADKIYIVHCGIDPEVDSLPPPQRDPSQELKILGVGQLNKRKGFHVLIRACALLEQRGVQFRCTIVGGGEEREVLASMVRDASLETRVRLTGAVKHEVVSELLSECDLFVLPCVISDDGWRDGIPVALMEAMQHRRTVVSSRILGLPELIDDGVNGRLVEPNDAEGLADVIVDLANKPEQCREMGERGRNKVLREFNNLESARTLLGYFSAT